MNNSFFPTNSGFRTVEIDSGNRKNLHLHEKRWYQYTLFKNLCKFASQNFNDFCVKFKIV
jgi:hypothetical protein